MSNPSTLSDNVWILVDLGFGDAGKGTLTDFLVRDRNIDLVVRYNGGAQAGHNVVTPNGRHHTFSQFGAGTFAGAATLLGPAFLLHPLGMAREAEHLQALGVDPWPRTSVDARARVITPYHQAAGRLREAARGADAHGTCGVGVGACVEDDLTHPEDTLRAADLSDRAKVRAVLARVAERTRAALPDATGPDAAVLTDTTLPARVADAWAAVAARLGLVDDAAATIAQAPRVVFEGAQGVLLDETWGFHPHTTWSDTTTAPALALLGDRPAHRLGVLRAYATRHGAGPFPTDGTLAVPEPHNPDHGPQGRFRTGALDAVLLRYALDVCPVDALALTCLDRVPPTVPLCPGYLTPGPPDLTAAGRLRPGAAADLAHRERLGAWLRTVTPEIVHADPVVWVEEHLAPVWVTSRGATAGGKGWRA